MADRYWVGGAGNWSDTARWSTTSGGASGASVPGVGDNAIFDASSDSGSNFTATVDTAVTVDNLTFTSVDRLITLGTAGNLTVSTATTISASAGTNGMLVSGNASLGAVTLTSGTLNIDGNTVTMSTFTSTAANTRTFNYGTNGTVTLTGNNATIWNISTAGTSTISGTGTVDCTYSGGTGTRTITNNPDTGAANTNLKISAGTDTLSISTQTFGSFDCTGFTGSFGGTASLILAGNFTLDPGMTYTLTGTITFTGTSTLNSAGKTLGSVTINGAGITVTLGSDLNIGANTLTVTQGTFTTSASNYNVTAGILSSSNSNTRTITLNGSTVTLSGATPIDFTTVSNLTFNAGTSQINLSSASATLIGGGQTFYNVSFTNTAITTASITGANTFNNLTFDARAATGLGEFVLSANQTVSGTFTVQSGATDPTKRLLIESSVVGTARTITSASNSLWGVDFQDITGAGVASWDDSSRTNYWGDCKGNSGITFATGRTVYWNLAGTQNWSATGWTDTSTGTPNAQYFPLAQDTATFTNAGSAGTVTINLNWNIGSIDMSGRTSAMTLTNGIANPFIYGSWTNGSGTTLTGTGSLTFAGRTTQTITSAGKSFTQTITIDSPSGTVQLGDNFVSTSTLGFSLARGTFDAQNNNFTAVIFDSNNSNTRNITMGSGLWTLSGTGTVWALGTTTNLTFNKDTANILLSNTSTTARTFAGGGLTYNKLTIGGATGTSTLTINGTNTFSELAATKTVAHIITFGANQTITTWSVTGTSGNVVTVNSTSVGSARTLTITNRTSGINWLDVRDITAPLAPVTFYAGANTRLFSNVLGVAARSPKNGDFIYVLASGTTWTVPADWNNANNEIHLFSGGGGGAGGRASGNNRAGGGGGGGAGYTKVTNLTLTPSSSVSYAIGATGTAGVGGADGNAGGNTTFDSGTYTTVGGGGGQATTTPTSTGGTAGTGSTFNGGVGGVGSTSTAASTGNGGGGGAGAGGPLGAGANGGAGFASTTTANIAGGGGGGNGGGSVGGNATSGTGGTGGNNSAGAGGGSASVGFNGGGGAGGRASGQGFVSGSGIDITNVGMGGSGGSGGNTPISGILYSGLFGGGGGGGGVTTVAATRSASDGGQGGIIIWYNDGVTPSTDGDFLSLFR